MLHVFVKHKFWEFDKVQDIEPKKISLGQYFVFGNKDIGDVLHCKNTGVKVQFSIKTPRVL